MYNFFLYCSLRILDKLSIFASKQYFCFNEKIKFNTQSSFDYSIYVACNNTCTKAKRNVQHFG